MAYIKNNWKSGDVITAEALNHLEEGVGAVKDGIDGAKGDPGASVKEINLTVDTGGKVTGGKATLTDGTEVPIKVNA